MRDSVTLVTGSTDGIGRQTAMELAQMGAEVLLHGRSPDKGQATLEDIRRSTGNDRLQYYNADFASLEQVERLAAEVQERHDRLDVLINNAGVYKKRRETTEDGLEMTFQVNHLATFLLTHRLLNLLKQSAPARIITVSSTTHQSAQVNFDNLQGEQRYSGYNAYALSKLGNILFTYELARRLKGSGVTANCLHPGGINTKLLHAGWGSGGRSVEEGAETPVYLATSPEVAEVTGKYFVDRRPVKSAAQTYNEDLQRRFWEVSEALIAQALEAGERRD